MHRALLLLALLSSGCAHWTVERINPDKSGDSSQQIDKAASGLRFYAPEPYLWILPAATGGCSATTVYLPNYTKAYVLRATGLGTTSVKPTLEGGWNLTGMEATTNTQTAEVLNAVGSIIGNVAKLSSAGGAAALQPQATLLGPGLYHPKADPTTGVITGLDTIFQLMVDGKPAPCPAPK